MALLNFKYGKHANLPELISNGTIYITTDEKAMYVDLENQRLRLSNIINLTASEWASLQPPYSTEAFYYITNANALLHWDGSAKDGAGDWVQINSLGDLPSRLTGLENWKVQTVDPTLGNHKTRIEALEDDVKELQDADDGIWAEFDKVESVIGYKGAGDTLPTNNLKDGDLYIHSGVLKIWIETKNSEGQGIGTGVWQTYSAAHMSQRVEGLASRLAILEQHGALNTEIARLEALINDHEGRISDNSAAIETLNSYVPTITDTAALATATKERLDTTLPVLEEGITNAAAAASAAQATADAAQDAAGAAQAAADAAQATANQAVGAAAAAQSTADQAINDAKAANDNANTRVLQTEFDAYKTAMDAVHTGLEDSIAAGDKAVREELLSKMQVADAMVYRGVVDLNDEEKQLPTTGVKKGFTYKAVGEFTYNGTNVYIGDLMIANGTEDDRLTVDGEANTNFGFITADSLTWDIIPSGYIADYNPTLAIAQNKDADQNDVPNKATVTLTSGAAAESGDLGIIAVEAAENTAVTVTASHEKLVIGMAWSSFDP